MIRVSTACIVICCHLIAGTALGVEISADPQFLEKAKRAMGCGALENAVGPWDYRTRESTDRLSWDHNDNMTHHYLPATARMRAGEYTQPVMHDLDFLMRVWPNHLQGLRALIQYEEAGGRVHQYRTVECYFDRARRFAPDDAAAALLEGYYYSRKKKNKELARQSYEDALRLQPDSADVNYNVGLFYLELGEIEKAAHHAQIAYSYGYPLPGLRAKLEKLGSWKDPARDVEQAPQTPQQ